MMLGCSVLLHLAAIAATARASGRQAPLTSPIRIAFYNGRGTFTGSKAHERDFYTAVNTAASALSKVHNTSYALTNITEKTTAPALNGHHGYPFDVVIFPGGSGTGQANALGVAGQTAVKEFVRGGGGYIGTCGGAFLAISHLELYGDPHPPTVEPWARGHGPVSVEFNLKGVSSLQLPESVYGSDKNVTIEYWQGPIIAAADLAKYSPQVNVLSVFRTEIHSEHTNETTGNMVNTPAMTSAQYGKGRVVLNSPHPEIPPELPPGSEERTRPEIYEGEVSGVLLKLVQMDR